jgi:hypothetical protein
MTGAIKDTESQGKRSAKWYITFNVAEQVQEEFLFNLPPVILADRRRSVIKEK